MTQFTTQQGEYIAVHVPVGAFNIFILNTKHTTVWFKTPQCTSTFSCRRLPHGTYSILGICSELTEEQWAGVVDSAMLNINGDSVLVYRDYFAKEGDLCEWYSSAKNAAQSLLRYNRIKQNELLIKTN